MDRSLWSFKFNRNKVLVGGSFLPRFKSLNCSLGEILG